MFDRLSSRFTIAMLWLVASQAMAANVGSSQAEVSTGPVRFAEGSITTGAYETTPTLSPDGKTAYMMRYSAETGGRAIFTSRQVNGAWSAAEPAALPANSGGPALSPDGSRLYFWSISPGTWATHLQVAERNGNELGQPRPLGAPLDGDGELSPSVAANGTIYFAARRKDTTGGFDVYRSRFTGGSYATPENLTRLNSQYDESGIAVAPDESYLVISVRGRADSRGESDLYLSMRQGESWMPPMLLSPQINTSADETNPQISPDSLYLYFTRAGDVYRVETASFLPRGKQYQGPWVERASMPTGRIWASVVAQRGKVYVINGLSGWGQGSRLLNAVEEYDPAANRWTSKANAPAGAERNIATADDESFRLHAGRGQSTSCRYSPSDDKWIGESGALPWEIDQNTGVFRIGGRLYAMKSIWSEVGWVSSFVEYDAARSTWVTRRTPPLGAPGTQTAVANGRIYLFGAGEKGNVVQEYDPATDSWTRKSPLPTSRLEVRFAVGNGKIYAVGGHFSGGAVTDTVEEYDLASDSWRSLPPLPEPLWGVETAAVDGRLYVFGGSTDAMGAAPASTKVWEYSPER